MPPLATHGWPGVARLAHQTQPRPLARATSPLVGQVPHGVPALSRRIIAPTGGEQRQRGMGVPMTARRMGHHDGAASECLASALANQVLQARPTASHPCPQQERGLLREGRAAHGRDGAKDVARDPPCMQPLAPLADPMVHGDFGTTQTPRRLAAHRPHRLALSTVEATVWVLSQSCFFERLRVCNSLNS